jgi:spore coat protein CotH
MTLRRWAAVPALVLGMLALKLGAQPQPPGGPPPFGRGGPGGPGGFMGQQLKLVKQFDKNGDGWLNKEERQAAREHLKKERAGRGGFGRGGFGPPGMFGRGQQTPPKPGPQVKPGDVATYPNASLYEPTVLRTFFLDFENKDWEAELEDFHGTDVEVPATLTVDGKTYRNVGVHFRGMSSYFAVRAGQKRSLNLKLALADKGQRLHGYRTLNLLNSHDEPSMMSTVLYSHVSRQYLPAPKANFVKVVINGESWGVYVNAQQFNKDFLAENYKTTKGTRWKVKGSPGGRGGLDYAGADVAEYRRRYEIKSGESDKAWKALIKLCKTLSETPADQLEAALAPMMDVDGLLWFLALDVALINDDGYWIRASDYSLYLDDKGKFHLIPHDMNEAFRPAGGPGFGPPGGMFFAGMPRPGEVLPAPLQAMLQLTEAQKKQLADLQKETDAKLAKVLTAAQNKQLKDMRERGPFGFGPPGMGPPGGFGPPGGGPGSPGGRGGPGGFGPPGGPGFGGRGGGVELDPLVGLDDPRKPLRSKVLAVPRLRAKYLQNVRTIAEKSLDWKALGPVVAQYRKLIEKEVEADTRKIDSLDDFERLTSDTAPAAVAGRGRGMNLRAFADQRRAYLLNHPEVKKAASGGSATGAR